MVHARAPERLENAGLAPWLVHGVADPTVPVAVSRELADRLKKAGITTSLHTIDGTHGVNENMVKLGQMWLADVVKP